MTQVTKYPNGALPRTPAWVVDGVYRALGVVDALLDHLGIPYSIVAGTLLGAVRHRGMIPWDTDGDLAIRQQDVALLKAEATSFLHPRGFGFCEYEGSVMRVFPLDGRRTGYPFRSPFVDVFPMSEIDGVWAYDLLQYRRYWPPAYLEAGSFEALRRCDFGALRLSCVSEAAALRYLARVYGDWETPKPRRYGPAHRPESLTARLPPSLLGPPTAAPRGPAAGPAQVVALEVDEVDDGLVILQRRPLRVHYLNNTAALVFLMSTGAASALDMALALERAFGLTATPLAETDDCIDRLLGLGVLRLLPDLETGGPPGGERRRSFLRRLVAARFMTPTVRSFSGATGRAARPRSAPAALMGSAARGEEVVLCLTGFGVGIAVRDTSALAIADRIAALMPAEMIGPLDDGVQLTYVVGPGPHGGVSIDVEGHPRRTFFTASDAVAWLRADIDQVVAFRATEEMFVHAGVVGWRGAAILIPGRSGTGKTSLVAALVDKGAVYYSDEYAPIAADGRVRSYARAPSVRRDPSLTRHIEPSVGVQARPPLPISLVVATSFQAGAGWQPTVVHGAAAMLALLDNVIMAREHPRRALATVKAVASSSVMLSGSRPEAGEIVGDLLERLDEVLDGEARRDGDARAPSSAGARDDVVQRMRVDAWTGEIVAALAQDGVRPILLKGPATVRWLYPEGPFRRAYRYVDLLVSPGDRVAARRALAARGFTAPARRRRHADGHRALSLTREADEARVDLHDTLHGMRDVAAARVWEAARQDAGSVIVGGSPVAVLGGAMRLLHVALDAGPNGAAGDRARADLTRALEVATRDEWESAIDLASELGVTHELGACLRARDDAAWMLERLGTARGA